MRHTSSPSAAELRVPVELRASDAAGRQPPGAPLGPVRWFRLGVGVSTEGLILSSAVPDELDGRLDVFFHLPSDPQPIRGQAEAAELVIADPGDNRDGEERAERRALRFVRVEEAARQRIETYIAQRLGAP
jgi:hypothetical protein